MIIQAGTFIFTNFDDREFVLKKLSDLLSQYNNETVHPSIEVPSMTLSPPLYIQYNQNPTEEYQQLENIKETAWVNHFSVYGQGVIMYRTNELYELIFQGIPDSLRNELWLIFSGAIHDVCIRK